MPEQFESAYWPFGEPDMVFEADAAYTLKADEQFGETTFTVPVELEEDTYITGYEFLVENPKNVHSITAWLNDPEGVEIPPIEVEVQLEYDRSDEDRITAGTPAMRDALLSLASDYSYSELEGIDGKMHFRDELLGRLNRVLEGPRVHRIYFTEFVVQ